jgi:HSP20 family protein
MNMKMISPYWATRNISSDLFDEMDRAFDTFNNVFASRGYDERAFDPACEISETEDHYLMSVDLPGLKKEDIKIEMAGDNIVVSGERKREVNSNQKHRVQRYEKSYGFFKRSFALPTSVDVEKAEAHYENGVLELYLPKTQAAKTRKIEIQSGKEGFLNKLMGSKKNEKEAKEIAST